MMGLWVVLLVLGQGDSAVRVLVAWRVGTVIETHAASGAIVASVPAEAVVLTCAHVLERTSAGGRTTRATVAAARGLVGVDVFRRGRAERFNGDLIAADFARDVAVVRIRPGRLLPRSRLVAPGWRPAAGEVFFFAGCARGAGPTTSTGRFLELAGVEGSWRGYACSRMPVEGQSGGGLFTRDGRLCGVANFADPIRREGLYAGADSIHAALTQAGIPTQGD
jgi:hypothetical protein